MADNGEPAGAAGPSSGGPSRSLSSAKRLVSGSRSDGSLGGDVRDVAGHTRAGAELGGRIGGGQGAAIGAVIGTGAGAIKNRGFRRRALIVAIVVVALPVLLIANLGITASQVGGAVATDSSMREQLSREAVEAEGLTAAEVQDYTLAADGSGTTWTVLAAIDRAAGGWSAPGDPPYGIELAAFNTAAAKLGVERLTKETAKDRRHAGVALGRLFSAMMLAGPGTDPQQVDAGAMQVPDPLDPNRFIIGINKDDPGSAGVHDRTRKAFEQVLSHLPIASADDQVRTFDAAFRWAIGQKPEPQLAAGACTPGQIGQIGLPGNLPRVDSFTDVQIKNAATTIAVGKALKLPELAWRIALMTALVESQLGADGSTASPDGNHDVGVFQQRALLGWYADGRTYEENVRLLNDVQVGAKTFYQGHKLTAENVSDAEKAGVEPAGPVGYHVPGLLQIDNWQTKPPGDVAQDVQRSAFPGRYAQRESEAVALINALGEVTGNPAVASDECQSGGGEFANCPATGWPSERGLKPDALRTLRCTKKHFPMITTIGGYYFSNSGEHPLYRAVDIMIPDYESAEGKRLGTEIAEWVKANQRPLGVMYVIWQEQIWSVERADEGWRQCGGASASCYSGPDDSAAHRNHVHVSVYGNKGVVDTGSGDGKWGLPTAQNYSIGHGVCVASSNECWGYEGHTGQDMSTNEGSPLLAVADGTVSTAKVICPSYTNEQRRSNRGCSYGRFVVIDHGGGVQTYYAHLNSFGPGIQEGVQVRRGQVIGTEGEQGNAQGAHLHFEVRRGGAVMNPITYLEQQGVPIRCSPQMVNNAGHVPRGDC
ncbi:M23 family metallopeptidase [Microlunatus speluncae]|uniref:M23 family metallopeptidase n=1 Tax=Microlunatus speluncae TaxID=2594267 RepID=UPI0012664FD6|nr:M23 family metallopeptidase [Microlunatus speluncae]